MPDPSCRKEAVRSYVGHLRVHDVRAPHTHAQVLAKLAHPNIVAYYGSFVDNEDLNVVMEYADGGTLSSHIQKAKVPFTEEAIMRLFTQVRRRPPERGRVACMVR